MQVRSLCRHMPRKTVPDGALGGQREGHGQFEPGPEVNKTGVRVADKVPSPAFWKRTKKYRAIATAPSIEKKKRK